MPITMTQVSLGDISIRIPVARLNGTSSGPVLLITAGNDGDEYAGITACYRIIEEFSHTPFQGTLIVVPVVNIPGFEAEKSENPIDGKFPKSIYPGNPGGTSTERIRHWLHTYIIQSDFWLDLHDGSLTERLVPFVLARKSHTTSVDGIVESLLQHMPVSHAVYLDEPFIAHELAAHGCGYLMCESGSFGNRDEDAIERHIVWTHTVMSHLRMLEVSLENSPKHIFASIQTYSVKNSGIWLSLFPDDNGIRKGQVIGRVQALDGQIIETITAKQDGFLLWGKEGLQVKAGNCIAGVGYSEISS